MRTLVVLIGACCVVAGGCTKKGQKPGSEPVTAAEPGGHHEYTNVHLIAAMPEEVEGVLVERVGALAGSDSVLGPMFETSGLEEWYSEEQLGEDGRDLWPVAYLSVLRAGVVVRATGGSHFKIPDDVGAGDVRQRMIVVVERPLMALRERLENGEGVNGLRRHAGEPVVYSAPSMVIEKRLPQRRVFVAIPDDNTLVMATSESEVRSMCLALRIEQAIPARWAAAAVGMELDSPLVILRVYHPDRPDDWSTPFRREGVMADVKALCASMPSVRKAELRLRCISPEPERAKAFYTELLGRSSLFTETPFGLEGVLGVYDGHESDDGPGGQRAGEVYFYSYLLYGQNIAI